MACLLLTAVYTTDPEANHDHSHELARSGAEPGCASGSCPSGGPLAPRFLPPRLRAGLPARGLHGLGPVAIVIRS
jgi:hypothetical protein